MFSGSTFIVLFTDTCLLCVCFRADAGVEANECIKISLGVISDLFHSLTLTHAVHCFWSTSFFGVFLLFLPTRLSFFLLLLVSMFFLQADAGRPFLLCFDFSHFSFSCSPTYEIVL